MTCPDCQLELRQEEAKGVEIDRCLGCQGVWFDAGELQRVRKGAQKSSSEEGKKPLGRFVARDLPAGPCPRCAGSTLVAGAVNRLSVGRCPSCMGVWVANPATPRPAGETFVARALLPSPAWTVVEGAGSALELALTVFDLFT